MEGKKKLFTKLNYPQKIKQFTNGVEIATVKIKIKNFTVPNVEDQHSQRGN